MYVWNQTPTTKPCTVRLVKVQRWSDSQNVFIDASNSWLYDFTVIHGLIAPETHTGADAVVVNQGESFSIQGTRRDSTFTRTDYGKWKCELSIEMDGKKRFQDVYFTWGKEGLAPLTSDQTSISALSEERERNSNPEIAVKLVDALFDSGDSTSSRMTENGLVTESTMYIALVVEFTSLKPQSFTIDKVLLSIKTPSVELKPFLQSELGPMPNRLELRAPLNVRELEPNVLVTQGISVRRYVRFEVTTREGRDEHFQQDGTFVFTATDSFGIDHICTRPPGPWISDPMLQMIKRFGPQE